MLRDFQRTHTSLRIGLCAIIAMLVLTPAQTAHARVRLGDVAKVAGQKETRLVGLGLVVGLAGTGDGGKSLPAIRALAAALKNLQNPVTSLLDLNDANNVAIVMIEATVPESGLLRGQKMDCRVSSFMGASSLRGGQLIVAPLRSAALRNDIMIGLAAGPLALEDILAPTTARVPNGVVIHQSLPGTFDGQLDEGVLTIAINRSHAGFSFASEVARVINREFSYESSRDALAKATGPGMVEVRIPPQYSRLPVEFIAQLMEIGLENPQTVAKVVINTKTETVIVTGEVEISPVVITHRNLSIEVGGGRGAVGGQPFVAIPPLSDSGTGNGTQSPVRLRQLVDALNQMQVPTTHIIEIIRELHQSGKLHAHYEEH